MTAKMRWVFLAVGLSGLGCATANGAGGSQPQAASKSERTADVTDAAEQKAMTPDQALAALRAGNQRFVSGQSQIDDYQAQATETAKGQYPFATILSCIDSRSVPEAVFDLRLGDAFVPRIAGNFVTPELLGSMEFATKVAGSKVLVVMGHTECGAVKGACDAVRLGNLTSVMTAIEPAIERVKDVPGERSSKNKEFVHAVTRENVRVNIENIRQQSPIIAELEQAGQLRIIGALHDLATGQVEWIEHPASAGGAVSSATAQ